MMGERANGRTNLHPTRQPVRLGNDCAKTIAHDDENDRPPLSCPAAQASRRKDGQGTIVQCLRPSLPHFRARRTGRQSLKSVEAALTELLPKEYRRSCTGTFVDQH
jgi:hypothetical protein